MHRADRDPIPRGSSRRASLLTLTALVLICAALSSAPGTQAAGATIHAHGRAASSGGGAGWSLSKALRKCAREGDRKRRARCVAEARRIARVRHRAAPKTPSGPSGSPPAADTVTATPPPPTSGGPPERPVPVDGPICPGVISLPCRCPPGTTLGVASEPSLPAGDGWVAVDVNPQLATTSPSCPGSELSVDGSTGTQIASATNVPDGGIAVFALPPGSYTAAISVARAPWLDASAAFTILGGQRADVTVEAPP